MPVQTNLSPFGNTQDRARDVRAQHLSPEEEESYLAMLARQGSNTIEVLGRALDTPGAIFRGFLAGDPASGFSWDPDTRVTGAELLEKYGLVNDTTNPWVKTGMGLAAEMALDPLAMISGPLRALNPAGQAAKMAGILKLAPEAAMAKAGLDDAARTFTGSATKRWAEKARLPQTMETFAVRPLIGQRKAQMDTTLDELVRFADQGKQQTEALDKVKSFLATKGLRYEDVADQKLSGALGLGYFRPLATFNPPGSGAVADLLDRFGQGAAWSWPVRKMSQMFDDRVNDTISIGDQVASLKHSRYLEDSLRSSRREAARHAQTVSEIQLSDNAKTLLGADSLASEKGNDLLTRFFENVPTATDMSVRRAIGPALDNAIASWDMVRRNNIAAAEALGMDISQYEDMFKVRYSPRTAAEADFGEYGSGLSRALYNTRMLEQKARVPYLQTPGGTVDLREVSLLPKVDDFARKGRDSQYTIAEVGQEIADYINRKHAPGAPNSRVTEFTPYSITKAQGMDIAGFMQRLDPRRPQGLPVFSEHPVSAQARNIVSQGMARANAAYIYESIAEAATEVARGRLPGGYKSAGMALNDIAKATGLKMGDGGVAGAAAQQNLRAAIAKRLGRTADEIDLTQFSVPEEVFNRLTRIQSFYSSPRAQDSMWEAFDKFTSLFKGFVLAWPSRFTRDLYSNVFSIVLENGSVWDTMYGLGTAKRILAGDYSGAMEQLRSLPMYSSIADADAVRRKFIEDAAASGILQTLASSDLVTANRAGNFAQLVPGSTPLRAGDAIREATKNWANFFQFKDVRMPWQSQSAYETLNPVLNASQKLSDFTDSLGRLGGYISLLRQGVAPDEAARRMTSALVDYSSLTLMERNFFRRLFPWWAYNSRIGKYVVQHLASNPGGGYAQTIRALNTLQASDEETYIPDALRQQFAFKVPDSWKPYLGIPKDSPNDTFFKDIDLPGVDVLSLFSPQDTITGTIGETASNLLNQVTPLVRAPLELATGTDHFSKRPIEQAVTPLDRIYMRAWGSPLPMDPTLRTIINNLPGLQRPIGLVGGLMDQRLPWQERAIKQAINTLSGIKLQDVDPEWKYNDARRAVARKLKGWTRTRTTNFVPKDLLPYMPPELLPYAALDNSLRLRADRINRQKAAARAAQLGGAG